MADQQTRPSRNEDARKAVRFLAIKAAIFILLPLAAAVVAAMVMLK
ncbi:MAG: phosphoribosylformylglycinamidine synthase [Hyphomicrobiaceae bacterium]|nr:phosphoribosylformylglycinamidine synthase [Hyphomicrobiaceae bacterium]